VLGNELTSDSPPDVYTATADGAARLSAGGFARPTTATVERAVATNGGLVVDPYSSGGAPVEVPHGYRADTFTYRADIYERLGLSAPASFQEVLDNARVIDDADTPARGYGLPVGGDESRREFQAYLARMGVSPVGLRWQDPDTRDRLEVHFPEDEVTALLEFFVDLSKCAVDPTTLDTDSPRPPWFESRLAQRRGYNNAVAGAEAADLVETGVEDPQRERVVQNTATAPLPYWEAGGVDRRDSWAGTPRLDGQVLVRDGRNTDGAREWLGWLYADRPDRTAQLYTVDPTRRLPAYEGVYDAERYRSHQVFRVFPHLYEQVGEIRETVVGDHYGNVPKARLDDPIARAVGEHDFYGEMLRRAVTGEATVEAAYEWGRDRLERALDDVRETFR
jgi:multiple sugar transport system substrate-binding protein